MSPRALESRPALLEREVDLERVGVLLDESLAGDGRMVVVQGEAGIGKTSLLGELARSAAERGMRVLSGRGGELEREFAFGVTHQLFEPVLASLAPARRRELFSGAAGLAASLLGYGVVAAPPVDPEFAANHGLYWLTANLSDERPLLLLIDDAHWADAPTLLFLAYLGRRLEGLPVLVAVGCRPAEPGSPRDVIDALSELEASEVIKLRALSERATATIVERALGEVSVDAFRSACYEATGGNPFLLEELLRSFAAEGRTGSEQAAEQVRRLGPRSIARAVLGRLGSLWPEALALARVVALLGTEAELHHVAKLAELDHGSAAAAADALIAAQVLAPGRPLRFIHPIVRQAVYEDMPPTRRSLQHARAARMLGAEGAEPERVALHLLATEPANSEWVVERLQASATRALQNGSAATAVTLLDRALAEPPPTAKRAELLLELGHAGLAAGHPRAVDWFEEAVYAAPNANAKAMAAVAMASAARVRGDVERALPQLDPTADVEPEVALLCDAEVRASTSFMVDARTRAISRGWELHDAIPPRGETPAQRVWLAQAARTAVMRCEPADHAIALVERALASGDLLSESGLYWPYARVVNTLTWCSRSQRAIELLEVAIEDARQHGSRPAIEWFIALRAMAHLRGGRIREAEADARYALDLHDVHSWGAGLPFKLAALVDALRELGDLDQAEQILAEHGHDSAPPRRDAFGIYLLERRAYLRLAEGNPERALADFLLCAEWLSEMGFPDSAAFPWRLGAALAKHALGSAPEARLLAAAQFELARMFDTPAALGGALLVQATVAPDPDTRTNHLRSAVATLQDADAPLEQAKALVDLGSALRRTGQRSDARPPLEQGMELAHRCGATALRERAHEELRILGARPRRFAVTGVDSLTASERRVAEMAAAGMTNRQIAEALFVTTKTVEVHLSHTYQKLDIESRHALSGAFRGDVIDSRSRSGGS